MHPSKVATVVASSGGLSPLLVASVVLGLPLALWSYKVGSTRLITASHGQSMMNLQVYHASALPTENYVYGYI